MPHSMNQLEPCFLRYGLGIKGLSSKQLEKHILSMYDRLEENLQENMLLKRENLDLQLQITTINDIFIQKNLYPETADSQAQLSSSHYELTGDPQINHQISEHFKISEQKSQQLSEQNVWVQENKLENSNWTLSGVAAKTQRKQRKQIENGLLQRIQILFCQNQSILQRLDSIQTQICDQHSKNSQANSQKNSIGRINYDNRKGASQVSKSNYKSEQESIDKSGSRKTATSINQKCKPK